MAYCIYAVRNDTMVTHRGPASYGPRNEAARLLYGFSLMGEGDYHVYEEEAKPGPEVVSEWEEFTGGSFSTWRTPYNGLELEPFGIVGIDTDTYPD